ncbi:hypothetical protein SBI67_01025 [Mycolicibacterium sp. 120266]|uniref:hypothetical protein n=1 Tax=Mycolicibacterium sp. 120266 TaxID=3090601 RepID=UPI00299E03B9|nr:hypothetical protein [Mycolicibacterium sp. 120266]MDX1870690.1 hypothetical protein [Mycolicibacterium sp. 120266]
MTEAQPSASAPTQQIQLHTEYAGSVHLRMLFSPSGPDAKADDKDFRLLAHGSAFAYECDGQTYLVTARHNLTGRHWQTNVYLGEYEVSPTHLQITLLTKPPAEGWQLQPTGDDARTASTAFRARQFLISLIGEDWAPLWKQHPVHGGDVDVAVQAINFDDDDLIYPWKYPVEETDPRATKWSNLAPAQDVFVVGYPYALSTGPLFPLWIRGTVASDTHFGVVVDGKQLPLILVDARTRTGQSGSVVIRHIPQGAVVPTMGNSIGITQRPQSQVVGVYSGRTSDESDLGYVWPIAEVEEICRSGTAGTI